ncbi:sugar phosphate isomerase/epimerase [Streptosporangium subroseum]|uniref:sugar phosphate isomerase/epimerase n=1 Tax=Streptosporangium subroseum TaxID=106412 RepID=UPI001C532703|nr:sugar phosphate isomerase/epimerase [Streptosporangium subroseum]
MDRYATDGYGPPVSTLEAIDLAGQVGDLSVVDLTFPFDPPDLPLDDVKTALKRNGLRAIAVTPEIYTRRFVRGAFTNPDPQVRRQAVELVSRGVETARELDCDYVKSSSTPCAMRAGRVSGSLTSSPSGRTRSRRPRRASA